MKARISVLLVLIAAGLAQILATAGAAESHGIHAEPVRPRNGVLEMLQRGKRNAHTAIVGGSEAPSGSFPYVAYVADFLSETEVASCTGTVIAPRLILTADHCLYDLETGKQEPASHYRVVTGNVDWTQNPRTVSAVSETVPFPEWNPEDEFGDFGILVLSEPVNAPEIDLGSLPGDRSITEPGTPVVFTGWGLESGTATEAPTHLKLAESVLQSNEYCASVSPIGHFEAGYQLCALNYPSDDTATCHGDSGGPALTLNAAEEPVEIGVTDFGATNCPTNSPSYFARVDGFHTYIEDVIELVEHPYRVRSGVYRGSKGKSHVRFNVGSNGSRLTGVGVQTHLTCKRHRTVPVSLGALSARNYLRIRDARAASSFTLPANRAARKGDFYLQLHFAPIGLVEAEVKIKVPYRSSRLGTCTTQFGVTAYL